MAIAHKAHSYAELVRQIRNDLRLQHPEWIQPNGQSPMCDFYEARLIELLSMPGESKMVAVSDCAMFLGPKNSAAPMFS
jgi:hypothetical protein